MPDLHGMSMFDVDVFSERSAEEMGLRVDAMRMNTPRPKGTPMQGHNKWTQQSFGDECRKCTERTGEQQRS